MFTILPDIWSVISRKVVLVVVCGRKMKTSRLNPFFVKVQNYPMQKYWIHDTFSNFRSKIRILKDFQY